MKQYKNKVKRARIIYTAANTLSQCTNTTLFPKNSEGGNRRWSHTVCDVHVSVYGKPDHLRTIQYRFRSLRGAQVMKYF